MQDFLTLSSAYFGFFIINDPIVIGITQIPAKTKNIFSIPTNPNIMLNMNVHNVEPKPNNIIDTADISAFLFDFLNHSKRFFTGTTYPQPSANPHNTPIPMYNATMFWICIAIPLRQRPKNRRIVEVIDATFMFFSTNGPKNAAPIPKKNIFKQKANCIAFIGELNTSAK